eukprot:CAMPEP_0171083626 /NCGR_PEP_ID=MMETSP0766_2-20121228/17830_1 /TAXON_ID=439317 /ORGANISM="Gambierdiscus australes, Strain CAWD 149" /LENGTH=71 /DNA_ID=CAMNT_0011541067 /DNA_START=143 /DNA_END=358 /DNA_ORIENTATION=+
MICNLNEVDICSFTDGAPATEPLPFLSLKVQTPLSVSSGTSCFCTCASGSRVPSGPPAPTSGFVHLPPLGQ